MDSAIYVTTQENIHKCRSTRILFIRKDKKKTFFQQLDSSVSLHQHSAILEIMHKTHAAYALQYCLIRNNPYSTCI